MLFLLSSLCLNHRYFGHIQFEQEQNLSKQASSFLIFNQVRDHFDPLNKSTFQQRYLVNTTFYKQGGPLLLMIGGEGEMRETELQGKYNINFFAQQLNGAMVALEHRYYGQSQPFTDMSNMSLLSSRQALVDCVDFLYYIKQNLSMQDAKVIVIGGSYSGNLAGWLREKYPHIVDIAISSSAPYFAQLDFPEYLKHSSDQFKNVGSEQCYNELISILQYGTQLLRNDSEKFAKLMMLKTGQLHSNLTVQDIATAEQAFWDYPTGLVQYHKAAGFNGSAYAGDIQIFCEQLLKKIGNATELDTKLSAYGAIVNMSSAGDLSYAAQMAALRAPKVPNDGRAWTYQTCAEFGYYQTSGLVSAYGIENDINYWVQLCTDVFYGAISNESKVLAENLVKQTNRHYGGRNVERNHIIITNGGVDPWSELSIRLNGSWATGQHVPEDAAIIQVEYGSHCSDMYMSWSANDDIRQKQLKYIQKWLENTREPLRAKITRNGKTDTE